jgi:ABC-type polysaccharide/polyol phosphate export permease
MLEQLQALWSRRDLVRYFVRTDLKVIYKHKVLGFLWTLLDPLMMMLVYTFLVVFIFRRGGPQFPVLLFSVLLAWLWFTHSVSNSVKAITSNAKLIQTVYFPKAVLPLSRVLVGLINFLFGLIVLVPLLLIFEANFTLNVLWLPLLIFIQFLFTAGAALLCAALGVYARDLENILQFGLRMWFYLSPALYSISDRIPERLLPIYMLNPFAALFDSYKNVLVRGMPPNEYMAIASLLAVLIFFVGLAFFGSKESKFAKDV